MKLALVLAAAALASCYSPKLDRCRVTCEDSDHCPGAQLCRDDQFCHEPTDELLCNPDAAVPDAGPDAEPPDGEPMPPAVVTMISMGGDFGCAIEGTYLYCWGYNRRGAIGVPSTTRRVLEPIEMGGGPGWTVVDAGDEHIVGIKNGDLYCWGSDDSGECNDASPNHLEAPTQYPGSGTGWVAAAAGQAYSCGIRDDNGATAGGRKLFCWGGDDDGQTGNGAGGTIAGVQYELTASDGAHDDWAAVSAGVNTACALRQGGELYCWGENYFGQGGDGVGLADLLVPTPVAASPDGGQQLFKQVSAGYLSSCAIGVDDALYCWGENSYNLIGRIDLPNPQYAPRRVGTGTDWSAISVYYFNACGSRADGVYCWGNGDAGQAGSGAWNYPTTPNKVIGIETSALVSCGFREACAAPSTGGVSCWGENAEGELGVGETSDKHVPTPIGTAGGWSAVAAGFVHTCGIQAGQVKCWGWNVDGQLDGTVGEGSRTPMNVPDVPANATEIAVGEYHSCALADDGGGVRPWCWGFSGDGQAGAGSIGGRITPTELDVAGTWHDLTATGRLTCALNGTTRWCWGLGSGYGRGDDAIAQLGVPTMITDGTTWTKHAYGYQWGCGVQVSGALACWGVDAYDTQGDGGSQITAQTPHVIDSGTSYTDVAAWQNDHGCAIQADGDLACWGRNDYGQTARTAGGTTSTPTVVPGTGDWTQIASGALHTCGIKDATLTGELWCWGTHEHSQLGIDDAYYNYRDTPTKVVTDAGWDVITTGFAHTCAIKDGDLFCWGQNAHGQIGDGTGSYNTPQAVVLPAP